MKKIKSREKIVMVGMLKRKKDLEILRRERWYKIPVSKMPARKFDYLAFYEPVRFGRQGKRIRYYARILRCSVKKRRDLLPDEPHHPDAGKDYFKIEVGPILNLPKPIKNIPPRRVSFGFATLKKLLNSKSILELYHVAPTEETIGRALRLADIRAIPQYCISEKKIRYRLDFAIVCKRGLIAVECDNLKAHSSASQQKRDKKKDAFLQKRGWIIIRLTENVIASDVVGCMEEIKHTVKKLGGLLSRLKYSAIL